MGASASIFKRSRSGSRVIYVDNGFNKVQKLTLTNGMAPAQLEELLITITGCDRSLPMVLMNSDGVFFPLNPVLGIPANENSKPYRLQLVYDNAAYLQLTQNISKMQQQIGEIKEILQVHKSVTNQFVHPSSVAEFHEMPIDEDTKEMLKTPSFNVWVYQLDELVSLLEHIYKEMNAHEELHVHPVTLRKWLICVKDNYRDVPFHNFRHCFAVSQMMFALVHMCKLDAIFTPLELSILLIACTCHDVDHPGLTNTYQVNARTELALRYNDISPLENHHCTMTFRILSHPELNLFFNTPMRTFRQARKLIIKLILSTDMSHHKEIMTKFEKKGVNFDWKNEDDKILLMQVIIKLCDLSNECRPLDNSKLWVESLLEEYFAEGDLGKREGLSVEPLMDRNQMTKPKAQMGFIRFVLLPMYETVSHVFPIIGEQLVPKLRAALAAYEEMNRLEEKMLSVRQSRHSKALRESTSGPSDLRLTQIKHPEG